MSKQIKSAPTPEIPIELAVVSLPIDVMPPVAATPIATARAIKTEPVSPVSALLRQHARLDAVNVLARHYIAKRVVPASISIGGKRVSSHALLSKMLTSRDPAANSLATELNLASPPEIGSVARTLLNILAMQS